MKKILSLIICFQIFLLPASAQYDFSDEAQAEFDRKKFQPVQTQPVQNNFYKKKDKKEPSNYERTNYTPPIIQEEVFNNTSQPQSVNNLLIGNVVKIPAGSTFYVTFDSGISSGSLEKNDRLTAKLTDDFIYQGKIIAPAGSLVYGTAKNAKAAGLAYGSGAMEINFNQILTPEGNIINVTTKNITLEAKSERVQKMTRDVVIGALGSMLIGAAFTALGGSDDWGRNMLVYGGIGAIGGGLRGTMQRGEDSKIPDGTTLEITLSAPLDAVPYRF